RAKSRSRLHWRRPSRLAFPRIQSVAPPAVGTRPKSVFEISQDAAWGHAAYKQRPKLMISVGPASAPCEFPNTLQATPAATNSGKTEALGASCLELAKIEQILSVGDGLGESTEVLWP